MNRKKLEKYLTQKEDLKTEIEQYETEIEIVKKKKKDVPYKLSYGELPENEKFDNVINQRKHFLDTVKLIAYRAETALSNIIKQHMSHEDESRLLLKQIYKTDKSSCLFVIKCLHRTNTKYSDIHNRPLFIKKPIFF